MDSDEKKVSDDEPKIESSMIISVDFGSFGCAMAYCQTTKIKVQMPVEHWDDINEIEEMCKKKNITAILLNKKLLNEGNNFPVISFGYKARNDYFECVNKYEKAKKKYDKKKNDENKKNYDNAKNEYDNYLYFEHFKQNMFKDNKYNGDCKVKSYDGKDECNLLKLIEFSLKCIKNQSISEALKWGKALGIFNKDETLLDDKNKILWVFSMPSIWDIKSYDAFRDCINKAGITNYKTDVEPVFALHRAINFDINDKVLETGKEYIIIDSGGGTTDVTCAKLINNKPSEKHYKTGVNIAGINVDNEYIKLLENIFGNFNELKIDIKTQIEIRQKFIEAKHSATPNDEFREVMLPKKFKDKLKKKFKNSDKIQNICDNYYKDNFIDGHIDDDKKIDGKIIYDNDTGIGLSQDIWNKLFNPTLIQITNFLKELLNEPKLKKCKNIIMCGGFSESKYLQNTINNEFKTDDFNIHFLPQPQFMVVYGGPFFACAKKQYFMMDKTYGIKTQKIINHNLINGKIEEYFYPFCYKNDKFKDGYVKQFNNLLHIKPHSTQIKIEIYSSNYRNPPLKINAKDNVGENYYKIEHSATTKIDVDESELRNKENKKEKLNITKIGLDFKVGFSRTKLIVEVKDPHVGTYHRLIIDY